MPRSSLYSQPSADITPNRWDILSMLIVISILLAFSWAGQYMNAPFHLSAQREISLSPWMLPMYLTTTTLRMFIGLALSFLFTFVVGTAAAKSERAGKLIIPLIDVLQSVPILGYLSLTIVIFVAMFPGSMLGPELAVIFAVFTSQVWNMTLSFYQSLRTLPKPMLEVAHMCQLSSWKKFWRIEVPFAMPGLLWNAMMSMSGGWFFIVAAESIPVANQTVMVPGVGSYIQMAILHKDLHAIAYAILGMLIVITIYDQLFFRPLIAWSEKFSMSEITEEPPQSWFLDVLQRAKFVQWLSNSFFKLLKRLSITKKSTRKKKKNRHAFSSRVPRLWHDILWYTLLLSLAMTCGYLFWQFIAITVPTTEIIHVFKLGFVTAFKILVLILLCSLIWLPAGVWIGMHPRATQWVQPIIQFLAAFPANLFFPVFFMLIFKFDLNPEVWTAPLMILGTQWFILFNVVAGASAIPKDLRLAVANMQLSRWKQWKYFLLPSVLPYYITGAMTAAGGAWNASIVSEYLEWGDHKIIASGLGAYITETTLDGDFTKMTLGIIVMCVLVVAINFVVWRPLYNYAEERYSL